MDVFGYKKDKLLIKMNKYLEKNSKTELASKLGLRSTNYYYSWNKKGYVPFSKIKILKEAIGVK